MFKSKFKPALGRPKISFPADFADIRVSYITNNQFYLSAMIFDVSRKILFRESSNLKFRKAIYKYLYSIMLIFVALRVFNLEDTCQNLIFDDAGHFWNCF